MGLWVPTILQPKGESEGQRYGERSERQVTLGRRTECFFG